MARRFWNLRALTFALWDIPCQILRFLAPRSVRLLGVDRIRLILGARWVERWLQHFLHFGRLTFHLLAKVQVDRGLTELDHLDGLPFNRRLIWLGWFWGLGLTFLWLRLWIAIDSSWLDTWSLSEERITGATLESGKHLIWGNRLLKNRRLS